MLKQFFYIFLTLLILTITGCDRKIEPLEGQQSILHISCEVDPQTLDPRQARDLASTTVLQALYEGLTRSQPDGNPSLALAETVSLSPDQKTYTFKLRPSAWSNGEPVTAHDFEKSWKSVLSPQLPAPNAYQLYVIKGAQATKEGKGSLDEVGIYALDKQTLVVELEQPTPYFLNLTATHFFFPVHASTRQKKMGDQNPSLPVTNGPFQLQEWSRHNQLVLIPNAHYWDHSAVSLNKLVFIVLDNPTALQLFQNKELEWTGSPLSTIPTDALPTLKETNYLQISPAAGVHLFRINTAKAPLNNPKMRHAFALALNRNDLIEHVLQGNQQPALGLIPPLWLQTAPFFQDGNRQLARQLFQEALAENQLNSQTIPPITLCYATGERSHKIAQVAQQQWKEVLGVKVQLQACESKVYFDRLKKQDYQIGIGSWYADFRDPISFLTVFQYKDNGTNNTQWENGRYIDLLNQSFVSTNPNQRELYLKKAEGVLIQEMPIIPLFFGSYNYLKHPQVKGVYFSELGYLDFKQAYLDSP
ncbi:putative periplasmic oligo/dipeptide-binding protein [Candidatus Protochlamydia naegleriophila]|uniref:Putative periplasmic oligo/dipeptide-binding protein n=1 Tax=Candidatus Protochlamydia naegleriophila TaxID=389348 RepID=A0A0U5JC28_9BACT|nr:peptide ABC transporter substrate-binding protein [Candidatus Protochlamydia naegleriophila]CUI15935.1 putative periplasmic oligo/dipeptide-binding protein [Candidatus Protochlamydia naegleriophila]